ncbi:outer membrane protein [Propylenella binzhouense]|nr:outer membrane beta-barrel protein [Propylenella binzhouense]
MKLVRLLLAGTSLVALSGMAAAADLYAQPDMAAASDRLACYVGAFGEGIVSHPEAYYNNVFGDYDMFGGRIGGAAGCDYVFASGWFVGAEATAAYGWLDGDLGNTLSGELPFEGIVRARIGTMMSPEVAAYIAGGFAAAHWKAGNDVDASDSMWVVGGQAAIGLEYHFGPHWRARAEYAYSYYGRENSGFGAGIPLVKTEISSHALRLGLLYGF